MADLLGSGIREMCSLKRFCAYARERERRTASSDKPLSFDRKFHEVDSNLAGEEVLLWQGLFDYELFVERGDRRCGPYRPKGGPSLLCQYRKRRKSPRGKHAESVARLAEVIDLPRTL